MIVSQIMTGKFAAVEADSLELFMYMKSQATIFSLSESMWLKLRFKRNIKSKSKNLSQ